MIKVNWRGQAIYIVRRTPEMLATLDSPELTAQPARSGLEGIRAADVREERARARSSPNTWCWSASARTWAARR